MSNKCMKDLAQEAKKRMKGGYWTNYLERREEDISIARRSGVSEDYVVRTYRTRSREELLGGQGKEKKEQALYQKVKAIMEEQDIVLDPIGRLLDGEEAGERYVLELANAYVRIKKRIEEEKAFDKLISG